MAWLAPFLVGRLPFAALANPPALVELFAETITEELDFRLEAQNMLDVARELRRPRPAGLRHPEAPPHPRHPTGAGDGAPRRLQLRRRGRDEDAGVDTHEVVRTGMIGFMEGALIEGVFHGDLHGGNLFVMPDGKVALLDFGITGRMDDVKRRAFLRLMLGAITNDVRVQLAALRDLGALPMDTDLEAVILDLGLEGPGDRPDPAHARGDDRTRSSGS